MSTVIYAIGGILLGIIGILSGVLWGKNRKIDRLEGENDSLSKQGEIYKANKEAMDEVKARQEAIDTSGDIADVIAQWNGVSDKDTGHRDS